MNATGPGPPSSSGNSGRCSSEKMTWARAAASRIVCASSSLRVDGMFIAGQLTAAQRLTSNNALALRPHRQVVATCLGCRGVIALRDAISHVSAASRTQLERPQSFPWTTGSTQWTNLRHEPCSRSTSEGSDSDSLAHTRKSTRPCSADASPFSRRTRLPGSVAVLSRRKVQVKR
jgi:predicted extracellular nuclease